jgi:hypothetical protein
MPKRYFRFESGTIHAEYDEATPDLEVPAEVTVRRASHVEPVIGSSPPRFVIEWTKEMAEYVGELTTSVDASGREFRTYSAAVAREKELLAERFFRIDAVGGATR